MEAFRSYFEQMDGVFMEMSEKFKKSQYHYLCAHFLVEYNHGLEIFHMDRISKWIKSVKDIIKNPSLETLVDNEFERIQQAVDAQYEELSEGLQSHGVDSKTKRESLGLIDQYTEQIFQLDTLADRLGSEATQRKPMKVMKMKKNGKLKVPTSEREKNKGSKSGKLNVKKIAKIIKIESSKFTLEKMQRQLSVESENFRNLPHLLPTDSVSFLS
jgi:uncharacterized protein YajQ (UPF0234 family)